MSIEKPESKASATHADSLTFESADPPRRDGPAPARQDAEAERRPHGHEDSSIVDVTDFQNDVIEASRSVPVLVDFWAPWCGPCRVLGPVLERLATQNDGSWRLAKVNTDQYPEISQQYRVRGIPSVKLFVDGHVVDEFTGALPEYTVKQWLDKALPSENRKRLERAQQALENGAVDDAETLLEEILQEEPQNPTARILLAQILAFRDPARAAELASGGAFAGPGFVQTEEAVKTVAALFAETDDLERLPEGKGREAYREGIEALVEHSFDTAMEAFIRVIEIDRYYHEDAARKAGVAIFTLLGNDHPVVKKYRRRFDMALY